MVNILINKVYKRSENKVDRMYKLNYWNNFAKCVHMGRIFVACFISKAVKDIQKNVVFIFWSKKLVKTASSYLQIFQPLYL